MFIKVENLYKKYSESEMILKNVNLEIEKGEVISIIGASGGENLHFLDVL